MSDPTAEARPSRLTGGCLVGIALGLMLLAVAAAFLLMGHGKPIDGSAQMRTVFGVDALPHGLQVEQAVEMASGEKLVVYSVPGRSAEAPAPPVPDEADDADEAPRFDWSAVEIPPARDAPRQAAFLFVPKANGHAVIRDMIRSLRGQDLRELDSGGGTVLIERGKLDFRGWDSDWVHLRTFERGGTFRDTLRLSLSTPDAPCVLTATWPRGSAGSIQVLEALISPLRSGG